MCNIFRKNLRKGSTRWQNHKSDSKNSKCHLPYGKNAYDKEKDKDKDKDNNIPPKSPLGNFRDELLKSSLPDSVKSALTGIHGNA